MQAWLVQETCSLLSSFKPQYYATWIHSKDKVSLVFKFFNNSIFLILWWIYTMYFAHIHPHSSSSSFQSYTFIHLLLCIQSPLLLERDTLSYQIVLVICFLKSMQPFFYNVDVMYGFCCSYINLGQLPHHQLIYTFCLLMSFLSWSLFATWKK